MTNGDDDYDKRQEYDGSFIACSSRSAGFLDTGSTIKES